MDERRVGLGSSVGEELGREEPRVERAPDRDGGHRYALRHLHDGQQRVLAVQGTDGDRDADDRRQPPARSHRAGGRPSLDRALRGVSVRPRESTTATPAGARTIRWTFTHVPEAERRIAVVAVGIDVSEQVELRRRSARAEALAAIGTLTAGLAHEIRNPLNAAALQLQLLERGARKLEPAAAERIAGRVRIVRDELGRLTKMLDDFLGLARPEEAESEDFSVRELLEEVRALEEPVCAHASIRLDVKGDPSVRVRADRHRLKQVLVNLVSNAREALGASGTIELGCEAREGVTIYVRDDGPGFSDSADKLFEPFFSTKAAGTGLGMSIVKKIVDMHGGTIALAEAPGGGALVRITLPR